MALEFRYATEDDAPAIYDLVQAAFAEYRGTIPVPPGALGDTVEDFRAAAALGTTVLVYDMPDYLAFEPGVLVATARYEPRDGYLYIGRVAVNPDYRKRSIGTLLMLNIEDLAPMLGYSRLYLGTRASMPSNLSFYKRLGYRVVKEEPHPRGPDVNVWFEKDLTSDDVSRLRLGEIVDAVRDLPGKVLEHVSYSGVASRLHPNSGNRSLLYIGGEVSLSFQDVPPRYLDYVKDPGSASAYTLRVELTLRPGYGKQEYIYIEASRDSIWGPFLGTPLRYVDLLGWIGIPFFCRFTFDAGAIYVGTGHRHVLGNADDIVIASEAGWHDLDPPALDLMAHFTPTSNPKSKIQNPKSK